MLVVDNRYLKLYFLVVLLTKLLIKCICSFLKALFSRQLCGSTSTFSEKIKVRRWGFVDKSIEKVNHAIRARGKRISAFLWAVTITNSKVAHGLQVTFCAIVLTGFYRNFIMADSEIPEVPCVLLSRWTRKNIRAFSASIRVMRCN